MRYLILILILSWNAQAQKDELLPKGNESYAEGAFAKAEADYRISESRSPQKATSSYNLGNSIYRQNQLSEAKAAYRGAIEKAQTRPQKHYAFHNLGNVLMQQKDYAGAVEAYKNALRNNPADDKTRYNFALAKKMLKENPPPKDDKKDDKKDKKDQKDDKQEQKQKNDDKGDKEKKKEEQDKNGKPKEQPQPKPKESGISKQRLDNLLDAVNNEEKKTQQKINAKKVKGKPTKTEKDW